MPLIDDLEVPPTDQQLGRRKFLTVLGCGAVAAAGAGTAVAAVDYLRPGALYEASARLKVGSPTTIPVGGVLAFPAQKLFVVRSPKGFVALSAVCTHLGCLTKYEQDHGRIFCPCHGSQYDLGGQVTGGPAPRALPRLKLTLENGVLVCDTGTVVAPDFVLEV